MFLHLIVVHLRFMSTELHPPPSKCRVLMHLDEFVYRKWIQGNSCENRIYFSVTYVSWHLFAELEHREKLSCTKYIHHSIYSNCRREFNSDFIEVLQVFQLYLETKRRQNPFTSLKDDSTLCCDVFSLLDVFEIVSNQNSRTTTHGWIDYNENKFTIQSETNI